MISGRRSYGWVIVAVSFLLLIGAFGTQLCFGLFLKPLSEEFGWSRAAVSGAMSLLMAVSGLMGVVMGRVTDRYGPRLAIAPGVVIGAASFALMSRMDSLWQFYLLFGVGGGILAGCGYTPSVTTISKWFDTRQRTMAIGVALLGIIVGQSVLSPVVSQVIESSGWRSAWVLLGMVVLVTGVPALVLIGKKREVGGRSPATGGAGSGEAAAQAGGLSTAEAARTGAFWILMLAGAVLGLGYYAFAAHVVPYATDGGISTTAAALILTVSSIGGAAGTLLAWAITGKLGFRWTLVLLSALNGLALFLFILAGSIWAFYLLAVLIGFAFSAAVPVRMGVSPPLFGLRAIGTILGLAALAFSIGAVAGPFLAGYIFDSAGSYDLAFLIFAALQFVGALALYFLRAPRAAARTEADSARPGEPIWRPEDGLG
jgi:MFS transporter, OFA family, oxalate/formate antiporter